MRLALLPGGVQTFDIKRIGSRVALGRKEGSDIIINEPVVSGTHCYITVTSRNDAVIEDVSTNGTYINGVKIGKGGHMEMHDGDTLTLGKPGTATGPIGTGVCVNFRVTFEPMDAPEAPAPYVPQYVPQAPMPTYMPQPVPQQSHPTNSVVFKQEIEDLKVMVSQGEHRNEMLSAKNAEISAKMVTMDNELRKVREDNIELTVRNDSMKAEIESLRLRLGQADVRADAAEKRAEMMKAKIASLERDCAELAQLRAEYNFHTSLREEFDVLRKRNNELNQQVTAGSDGRRKLVAALEQIQQTASSALRGGNDAALSPQPMRTFRAMQPAYTEAAVESVIALPDAAPIVENVIIALPDKQHEVILALEMPPIQAIMDDTPRAHDEQDLLSGTQ